MSDREATFDVIAHDRATSTLDKVGGGFGRLGKLAGGVGKTVALGIGTVAAGGVVALGAAMVQGVKDAASYQTLAAKTAAVLKSTGNVAGTSVGHIQELAGSLESLSGVDEELIINSQNVLATFTDIRNEAGKGNDIFDQAAKSALNMSTALGTDLQGSTVQLGKALNDPIKGVSALSRVGVSFTEQQKKTIKSLVESGDKMGAQKLILAELNKEFGGAAEAAGSGFNGSLARLQDTLGDTGRALGEKLLPHITDLFNWLNDKLPKAFAWIQDVWESVSTAFSTKDPFGRFTDGAYKMQRVGYSLRVAYDKLKETVGKFSDWLTGKLIPAVQTAVRDALPKFKEALDTLKKAFSGSGGDGRKWGDLIVSVVTKVIAIAAYMAPIVADHIHRIVVGIKVLWNAFKTTANIAFTMADGVIAAVGGIIGAMAKIPGKVGQPFRDALPGIRNARRELQSVRDAINGIPSNKNIIVKVNGRKVGFNPRTGRATVNNKPIPDAFRASGGPVAAGAGYIVGENGPEWFSPGSDGMIVPNHALGGGSNAAQTSRMLRSGRGAGAGATYVTNNHFHGAILAERDALAFLDQAAARTAQSGVYVRAAG